jgi:hypothetical protein
MNELTMVHGTEPRKILQNIIDEKMPAIMTYLSKGKWHVAKVLPTNLGVNCLTVEVIMGERPQPINIEVEQPVGMSIKYGYGKFVFDTTVINLEPARDAASGGTVVLALPKRVEISVPKSLKVNVMMWHRCCTDGNRRISPERYWQGKLLDISAGGLQMAVDVSQEPDFRQRQFVGMRFTPMPYETPLMFSAQVRSVLPTPDGKTVCFGLQMVGLEASSEGRAVLQRICSVTEQYYQINQSSAKQQDFQTTSPI